MPPMSHSVLEQELQRSSEAALRQSSGMSQGLEASLCENGTLQDSEHPETLTTEIYQVVGIILQNIARSRKNPSFACGMLVTGACPA